MHVEDNIARKKSFLEFPYLSATQGKHNLVVFVALAKSIWKFVNINRRDSDKDEGYQRVLSLSRVKRIAKYIDDGNSIPNSLLISLDKATLLKDKKIIKIPNISDAGWVIDGQHRLAGANKSEKNIEFVVIAFIGIELEEQIKLFVDINREQKGVPTSLYYDLLKHLPPSKSDTDVAKERATDVSDALKTDEDSPLFRRIVIASPKRGEVSLTNFVRKIYPLVQDKKGKFHIYTLRDQIRIFGNYFKALQNIFPEEFKPSRNTFFKTLGFGAMLNALPTVFDVTLGKYKAFTVADISRVLKSVDYFQFSAWDHFGTGNAAEIQAGEDFRQEIIEMLEEPDGGIIKLE